MNDYPHSAEPRPETDDSQFLSDETLIRLAANPGDESLRSAEIQLLLECCPASRRRLDEFSAELRQMEPEADPHLPTRATATILPQSRSPRWKRALTEWAIYGCATAAALLIGFLAGRFTTDERVAQPDPRTSSLESILANVAAGRLDVGRNDALRRAEQLREASRASQLVAMLDPARGLAITDETLRGATASKSGTINPLPGDLSVPGSDRPGSPDSDWLDRIGDALWTAAEHNPDNVKAAIALGNWFLQYNKYEEAREQFGRVLRRQPGHRAALLGSGLAYFRDRDFAASIPFLEQAARAWPEAPQITRLLKVARAEAAEFHSPN